MSPYLFVISMERIGHKIQDAIESGYWKPITFGISSNASASHLFFADDLVLLAEASPDQFSRIRSILDEFYDASGQKVNLSKPQVFFSKNVSNGTATDLSNQLDIAVTSDLGRYLGAPLLHQLISKHSFAFMLDRTRKKLIGWKASTLSFAGRITLAQSSLLSIPGYTMQTFNIPVSVCDEAKKIVEISYGVAQQINVNVILYLGTRCVGPRKRVDWAFATSGRSTLLI